MPGTSSSADTKCISDVPGLPKQTSTPESTRLRISDCAPFMAAQSRASRGTATCARRTCFSSRRDAWGQGFGETVAAQCRGVCRRAGVHARQRGSRSCRNRASAQLQRARQRGAGVRHRAGAERPDVARERCRQDGGNAARGRAGRPRVSQRHAGQRLPRPSGRRGHGVGSADRAQHAVGPAEHGRLRAVDPLERLRLSHHPRRHQAGDLRSSAAGRHEGAAAAWRPSASAARLGTDADADRVLRLRVRGPGRSAERDLDSRQPHGLHGGGREHARHRLLGWRLRLLRAAPEPRRLRRDRDDRAAALGPAPQGRDDGHLLRRDQPAVHRPDPAAEPRGHRALLGDRLRADDAVPGRDPQHGLRGGLGPGANPRRAAGVAQRRASRGRTRRSRTATRPARPIRRSTARPWT